jgi:hypothetical protein
LKAFLTVAAAGAAPLAIFLVSSALARLVKPDEEEGAPPE